MRPVGRRSRQVFYPAEGVGFEPTRHFCPPVFKTGSIGRSDSPPRRSQNRHARFYPCARPHAEASKVSAEMCLSRWYQSLAQNPRIGP